MAERNPSQPPIERLPDLQNELMWIMSTDHPMVVNVGLYVPSLTGSADHRSVVNFDREWRRDFAMCLYNRLNDLLETEFKYKELEH